jgi:hypothetical protein
MSDWKLIPLPYSLGMTGGFLLKKGSEMFLVDRVGQLYYSYIEAM